MKRILWLKTLIWGFIAGVLAGLAMLLTMALLRLFAGHRARHCFSGNANFVFSLRARDHVFLWFVKQLSVHGDGGRTRNRGGAIGRSPPLCRTWDRSGPRTRAW